jgi:hypothetical protein
VGHSLATRWPKLALSLPPTKPARGPPDAGYLARKANVVIVERSVNPAADGSDNGSVRSDNSSMCVDNGWTRDDRGAACADTACSVHTVSADYGIRFRCSQGNEAACTFAVV